MIAVTACILRDSPSLFPAIHACARSPQCGYDRVFPRFTGRSLSVWPACSPEGCSGSPSIECPGTFASRTRVRPRSLNISVDPTSRTNSPGASGRPSGDPLLFSCIISCDPLRGYDTSQPGPVIGVRTGSKVVPLSAAATLTTYIR